MTVDPCIAPVLMKSSNCFQGIKSPGGGCNGKVLKIAYAVSIGKFIAHLSFSEKHNAVSAFVIPHGLRLNLPRYWRSLPVFRLSLLVLALLPLSIPANAQDVDEQEAFVEANILSIFYHELGHAVIDLMQVPIYGQEEDAADVMAVLLINELFEEAAAQSIAYDSAFGFINDPKQIEEVAYWDLHGPDEQRYYNHVCLFYGANAEERETLADDLGLPKERAETCSEEFALAHDSWSAIFDEMDAKTTGGSLVFSEGSGEYAQIINQLLAVEVVNINADFRLPQEVRVNVESCGEPNAFCDPESISITFCTDFVPQLESLFKTSLSR